VQQMRMDLMYGSKFEAALPEAYERLLLEVLAGDHSHFVGAAELDASWRIFTPALHKIVAEQIKPQPYAFGSRGPAKADELAHRYGMSKFGGGIQPYVTANAPNRDDEHERKAPTTSAAASAASMLSQPAQPPGQETLQ